MAPTSSFPKAWHARKQNCYSLLDYRSDVGHLNYCNTETTIDEKASCAWRRRSGCGAAVLAQQKGYKVFLSDKGKIKEKPKSSYTV